MQIELLVRLDMGAGEDFRFFSLHTERPYPRVPVAGEVVSLDDGDGSYDASIDSVSWSNNGVPTLEFRLEEKFVSDGWFLSCGYERIDETIDPKAEHSGDGD